MLCCHQGHALLRGSCGTDSRARVRRAGSRLPLPHLGNGPPGQHLEVLRHAPFGGIKMPAELIRIIDGEPARAPVRRSMPPVT